MKDELKSMKMEVRGELNNYEEFFFFPFYFSFSSFLKNISRNELL